MKIEQTFTIPDAYFGKRLDQVLAELMPDYSRARIQAWLTQGQITINGKVEKAKTKILGGEQVSVNATLSEEHHWEAQDIPLDVIYEDDALLVINKPAGLVTHPAAGNPSGTLVNALLHHCKPLELLPRAGLIHRLDKDTTGLLVIAKTLEAHTALSKAMQAREIKREYIAITNGLLPGSATIEAPIGRHSTNRQKMSIHPMGKPAITHYRAKEYFRAHTLVKLILETGRTHQIRVHLAHIKYPVLGDQTYGVLRLPHRCPDYLKEALRGFKRQALHAKKLTLIHPVTHKELTWQAPIPSDMENLIELLRQDKTDAASMKEAAEEDWDIDMDDEDYFDDDDD